MTKYKVKCQFCGYEDEYEAQGKLLKAGRCPKCNGFLRIVAEEYKAKEEK